MEISHKGFWKYLPSDELEISLKLKRDFMMVDNTSYGACNVKYVRFRQMARGEIDYI